MSILTIIFLSAINPIYINQSTVNEIKNNEENKSYSKENLKISEHWALTFIHVDYNWTTTNITYDWCYGKGTVDEPYIVENVTISGGGSAIGIIIENTREYFEIRNCNITNVEIGIKILNATNIKITNTVITNINGLDGADGTQGLPGSPGDPGKNGHEGIGIVIIDCLDVNI
ncbi:MAG TPA: collagen-like protein, partial [Candidatus Lokiarchaeia archaeon]